MEQLYDEQIERLVIGSVMGSTKAFDEVAETLSEECFHVTEYKRLYRCLSSIVASGNEPDVMTVHRMMRDSGYDMPIADLLQICNEKSFNVSQHAAILHDLMVKRGLITLAEEIKAKVYEFQSDPYETISEVNQRISKFYRNDGGGISSTLDALVELQENIKANVEGRTSVTGTATGFRRFDESTAGLHRGDLIFIAAESSQGKTSIALNICTNAAKCGEPLAIYSMEMTKLQLMARMVSSESGVNVSSILYKPLSETQLIDVDRAMGNLSNCKMYFDDRSTSNIDSIITSIRFMVKRYSIRGALIDYIQLLSINGRKGLNEEQSLGEFARQLKNLAKELDIWIIALSQLNRSPGNPIPNDNRLRGSGQLKEAADTVMMIYRPEACDPPVSSYPSPYQHVSTQGTALIKITKGRNTGQMEFFVGFDAKRTRFYELDEQPQDAPCPTPDIPENINQEIRKDERLPF